MEEMRRAMRAALPHLEDKMCKNGTIMGTRVKTRDMKWLNLAQGKGVEQKLPE